MANIWNIAWKITWNISCNIARNVMQDITKNGVVWAAVSGLLFYGSGCSSNLAPVGKMTALSSNANVADFNTGYSDGCASGYAALGNVRYLDKAKQDQAKYPGVKDYKIGWDQGFAVCQEKYMAEVRAQVKQNTDVSSGDPETRELREKIWSELKK